MKKLFSLLLIVGLGCFAIGCSGEPAVSDGTNVSEDGEAAVFEMTDPAGGIDDSPDPSAETPADGGEATDGGESSDGATPE